jgi:hypothetical protein
MKLGEIKKIKENYPKGTKVRAIKLDDPYVSINKGDEGIVDSVDDMGTVHILWDKGFRLGAVLGVDEVEKIDK